MLLEDGPQVLKACLDAAEPVPIRGLFHFDAFRKEVSGARACCAQVPVHATNEPLGCTVMDDA